MKEYFKRLKNHEGLEIATFVTILGTLAGASNKSFHEIWQGAVFGLLFCGGFCWAVVLISNLKK